MLEKILKECDAAEEYLQAMKKHETNDKGDCDNVRMHVAKIRGFTKTLFAEVYNKTEILNTENNQEVIDLLINQLSVNQSCIKSRLQWLAKSENNGLDVSGLTDLIKLLLLKVDNLEKQMKEKNQENKVLGEIDMTFHRTAEPLIECEHNGIEIKDNGEYFCHQCKKVVLNIPRE